MKYIIWEVISPNYAIIAREYDSWEEVCTNVHKFCEKHNILGLYEHWMEGNWKYIVYESKGIFVTSEYLNKPIQ
jgi:hypothetical protein